MRDIQWDNDSSVTTVSGELVIGGEVVSAEDLSIERSIPSSLPDQVAGVGGYSASTASATVLQDARVTDRSPVPWGAETPQPMAPVEVYALSGTSRAKVFSGVVDKAGGAASESDLQISMVDNTDQLNRVVSIPPLARIMPAPTTDGVTNPMNIGLVSSYFVDRVLRDCGYFTTPPMPARTVLSVPLVGSAYPERGTIVNSRRSSTWREQPYFAQGWDSVMGNRLYAEYVPDLGMHSEGNLSRPLEINLTAAGTQETSGRVYVQFENGARIAVVVTSSRSILVQFRTADAEDWATYLSATDGDIGRGWRRASIRIEAIGNRRGRISIRTNNRGSKVHPSATLPWGSEHLPMTRAVVDLRGNDVGGVQVAFPAVPSGYETFVANASITAPPQMASLFWSPPIQKQKALDLLTQWAEAECAAFWVDEDDKVQWRSRNHFTAGDPVVELTSTNDILDLTWSHDAQGASARAVVKYQQGAVKRANRSRIPVWQGSGETMEPGDEFEEFITAPDDEIWINVDSNPNFFQAETSKNSFNRGVGSWMGYVAYDKDGNIHPNTEWVGYQGSIRPLGGSAYHITHSWVGNVPNGVTEIKLATQDTGTVLKPQWRDYNLPVLRAQMKISLTDVDFTASVGGPSRAPDLVHEAGWWIQTEDMAKSLAFWLAQQTAKPFPVVDGVETTGDARLMIGDMVTVTDTHRTGLRITGVVRGIRDSIAAGDYSQTLQLLVVRVHASRPTLFEYDQLWGGATLEERDRVWADKTLGEFDAAPLARR
jgi:hypothetical protein